MSAFHHNSLEAEVIALAWHVFGVFVSAFLTVGSAITLMLFQLVRLAILRVSPLLYAGLYYCAWAAIIISFAGALFHVWAVFQHKEAIARHAKH